MKWTHLVSKSSYLLVALALAGCAGMGGDDGIALRMTGVEEVPPVSTDASGVGTLRIAEDRTVSGSFKLQNAAQILVAHIHTGPAGVVGPIIIPLRKVADNEWVVPPGAKLTEEQYKLYQAGGLYVNFHSAKYKGGEIRAQIRPAGGGAPRSTGGY
jgi:hypothetical protein